MALINNFSRFVRPISICLLHIGCAGCQLDGAMYMAANMRDKASWSSVSNAYISSNGSIVAGMEDHFYDGIQRLENGLSVDGAQKIWKNKCGEIKDGWNSGDRNYAYISGGHWWMIGDWAVSVLHDDKSVPSWDGLERSIFIKLSDPSVVYYRCIKDDRPVSVRQKFPFHDMLSMFETKTGLRPLPRDIDDGIPHALVGLWDIQQNKPDAKMVWYVKDENGCLTDKIEREERLAPIWTTRMGYPRAIDLERIRKGDIPVINSRKLAEGDWGIPAAPPKTDPQNGPRK